MAKLYNLCRMSTGTTGTGTITLGSAVTGFLSFAAAGVGDGETVTYAIQDGSNSEIGRGVYTASGTTLSRSVLKSTNSGSAINLSGTAQVFITASAEDFGRLNNTLGSYAVELVAGTNVTANRTLTLTTGDADRTLTLAGDASLNQDLTTGASPTFGGVNVAAINGGPLAGVRNRIINGNFDFWQRGTSATGVTNAQFVADRFKTLIYGSTADVSRQSFAVGQTDVPNQPSYFHRAVVSSASGAGNYCLISQSVESVRTLAGQSATLSFWAKADASRNIAVELIQNFGSGGSPSSQVSAVGVTTCALTTSWQKFSATVSLPSISGKTIGTNNDDFVGVFFWLDAGSDYNSRTNSLGQQSGTFDIAQVQLEPGTKATSFEARPLGVELALCRRYYLKSYPQDVVPGSVTSPDAMYAVSQATLNYLGLTVEFPETMRAVPTVTIYSPGTGSSGSGSVDGVDKGMLVLSGGAGANRIFAYINNLQTTAGQFLSFHYTASAEL